jgi:hypothetical protein
LHREARENLRDKQKEIYRQKIASEPEKATHPETSRTYTSHHNYMNPNTKTYVQDTRDFAPNEEFKRSTK